MADWKQIQGRIRRARASPDPAAQLQQLFEKTHDPMAAFELARHLEGAGQPGEAARWYAAAAGRFRRADWKKRAEEAAARLNGGVAADTAAGSASSSPPPAVEIQPHAQASSMESAPQEGQATNSTASQQLEPEAGDPAATHRGRRRRRGRRGGRNRRPRGGGAPLESPASESAGKAVVEAPAGRLIPASVPQERAGLESARPTAGEVTVHAPRGRSGDPALSSRLAQLEMQLRRLLACQPVQIEHAERAPAGPGVFLVSDSDQITNYYAEACATLRIGIANLLRSSTARRGEETLKARFAEHLGIPETQVAKYLKDHCVVRWLQLDEGTNLFAYFTIAILRPVLND